MLQACVSSTYNPALGLGYNVNQFLLWGIFFKYIFYIRYGTELIRSMVYSWWDYIFISHKVVIYRSPVWICFKLCLLFSVPYNLVICVHVVAFCFSVVRAYKTTCPRGYARPERWRAAQKLAFDANLRNFLVKCAWLEFSRAPQPPSPLGASGLLISLMCPPYLDFCVT